MKKLGYIAIFIVAIVWGISFVSTKILLETLLPSQILFIRYFFANVLFTIIMLMRKETFRIRKQDIAKFVSTTFIGTVLYFVVEAKGLERLNATTATLILSLIPVFIMFTNRFTQHEEISKRKKIAVLISVVGVYLVVQGETGTNQMMGYVYMFVAVLCWVFYTIVTNKLTNHYSEIKVTAIQSLLGSVVFLPVLFTEGLPLNQISTVEWLNLLYLGVGSSAFVFTLYVFAIKQIGNTVGSLVINFIPLVTLIFGYVFLKETLTPIQLLGGAIILIVMSVTIYDDYDYHVEIR